MNRGKGSAELRSLATVADRLSFGHECRSMLLAVARSIVGETEAEDVVSDVILRGATAPVRTRRQLRAWLLTSTRRACYDVFRRAPSRRVLTCVATADQAPDHADAMCQRAELRWLARYVEGLPKERRIVAECLMAGLSAREVAARLGVTPKAAQRRIDRTRAHLRLAVLAARASAVVGVCWRSRRHVWPVAGTAVAVVTLVVVLPPGPAPSSLLLLPPGQAQVSAPRQQERSRGLSRVPQVPRKDGHPAPPSPRVASPLPTTTATPPAGGDLNVNPTRNNRGPTDLARSCVENFPWPPQNLCVLGTGSPSPTPTPSPQ